MARQADRIEEVAASLDRSEQTGVNAAFRAGIEELEVKMSDLRAIFKNQVISLEQQTNVKLRDLDGKREAREADRAGALDDQLLALERRTQ